MSHVNVNYLEDYLRQQKKNMDMAVIRSKLFVASFSETNISFPMWGYYADEHKGICLGYDLKELIKRYCCFPVIYREELPMYSEQDDANILLSALTKSIEWSHEREWRIVESCCEHEGESGIILDNFPDPVEIYIGIRHKDTVYDLIDIKERDFETDEKLSNFLIASAKGGVSLLPGGGLLAEYIGLHNLLSAFVR